MKYEDTNICNRDYSEKIEYCNCNCPGDGIEKHLAPNRTTLKCSNQAGTTLSLANVTSDTVTLATLSIRIKNYQSACVKLNFACNIITVTSIDTIDFQIFKQCKNQITPIPIGSIWRFTRTVADSEGNSFDFFVCDCDICNNECCIYSVVATITRTLPVQNEALINTFINNAAFSATIA